jgi:hypothetical protein
MEHLPRSPDMFNKQTLTVCGIMLSFQVLRGGSERTNVHDIDAVPHSVTVTGVSGQISASFADMAQLYSHCPVSTFDVLHDIDNLTRLVLSRNSRSWNNDELARSHTASYEAQLHQIYTRLLSHPSTEHEVSPDWIYECCRLAALIFCRSIVYNTSLSTASNSIDANSTVQSSTPISSLHNALQRTDVSTCWGELRQVFLWTCLIGGAASWSMLQTHTTFDGSTISSPWIRKCFALYAIRAAVSCAPEDANTTIRSLRTILAIRHFVDRNSGPHGHGQ